MRSRVHSTHALTLHACAVVEERFVTERKKNNNKTKIIIIMEPNLYRGRFLRKDRVIIISRSTSAMGMKQTIRYWGFSDTQRISLLTHAMAL